MIDTTTPISEIGYTANGQSRVVIPIIDTGYPIEISTSAGMNAVLIADNVGKVYKYTGTTDSDYTNGDLYEVEASE